MGPITKRAALHGNDESASAGRIEIVPLRDGVTIFVVRPLGIGDDRFAAAKFIA
jgi:hypothetical protein